MTKKENQKVYVGIDCTNLDKLENQLDRIIEKLKEANSLADKLASKNTK